MMGPTDQTSQRIRELEMEIGGLSKELLSDELRIVVLELEIKELKKRLGIKNG